MIKLTAIGYLGKDAITNNVNGKEVINFSIAHTNKIKDKEETIWIECSWWFESKTIASFLKKGVQVYVDGVPGVRQFKTKNGDTNAIMYLKVSNLQLLGKKETTTVTNENNYEGEIPF